jgi:hypothetical protein
MKKSLMALAAMSVMAAAQIASALPVSFTTTGLFNPNNGVGLTNVVTINGMTITYNAGNSSPGFNPSPVSFTDFGTFTVAGAATSGPISSVDFTLSIVQAVPLPGGTQAFGVGSVSGTLNVGNSTAFVQFTSPLSVTFTNTTDSVIYTIISNDIGTPGSVALKPPGEITTVQGRVNIAAVPLPASVWGGMGLFAAMGAMQLRRKMMKA